MTTRTDRRSFLKQSAVAATAVATAGMLPRLEGPVLLKPATEPCLVASANGIRATAKAFELMQAGTEILEAIVTGVKIIEDDPNDNSVGYGGIPNEAGVVELDASVMHGPSGLCGAVGALQNIKNPARVAKLVMETTDHDMLVGPGALAFAKANGFPEENLLTEDSRKIWLWWRQSHSQKDAWRQPAEVPEEAKRFFGVTGTVNVDGVDAKGNLAGCTSTSGLAFKIPGRVGDSPIIGAGLYVDNAWGAAGSTGRGEANIIACGAHTIIEALRRGMHPKDACMEASKRVAEFTRAKHLIKPDGHPNFDLKYYCVDKSGRHGGSTLYGPAQYAVTDTKGSRLEPCATLFEK